MITEIKTKYIEEMKFEKCRYFGYYKNAELFITRDNAEMKLNGLFNKSQLEYLNEYTFKVNNERYKFSYLMIRMTSGHHYTIEFDSDVKLLKAIKKIRNNDIIILEDLGGLK